VVGQSLYFVGSCIGTIIFGYLSDRFGRLPVLLCSTLAGAIGDFSTAFVYDLPGFAICRFISGLSCDTLLYLIYILGNYQISGSHTKEY